MTQRPTTSPSPTNANLIRFDWAMKRLLRNKANYKILEGFLSELLKENIVIKNLEDGEGNQDSAQAKFNRVDILATNSKDELILIEVQNNREVDYFQRMLFGVSKLITDHIQKGQGYERVKKVYSVNIVYFDLGQGTDYIYQGTTRFEGIHTHDLLNLSQRQKELFSVQTPDQIMPVYYIIKVNQFNDNAKDTLDEWVYYFKNNALKDQFKAQGLKEVREFLKVDAMPQQERKNYDAFLDNLSHEHSIIFTAKDEGLAEGMAEGLAQGLQTGRAQGKAEGILENRIEMARKMLAKGLAISDIAQFTDLSEATLRKLKL